MQFRIVNFSISEDSIPDKMSYASAIRDLLIINRGFDNFFCNIVKHQCAFYAPVPDLGYKILYESFGPDWIKFNIVQNPHNHPFFKWRASEVAE